MSEESKRERKITFKRIREDANDGICTTIENCHSIERMLDLKITSIPNIIIAYNNKIIELEKEFTNAGIDFYDRNQCESRFIIENRLQSLILLGKNYLLTYVSTLNISKKQVENYINSYKKVSTFDKLFKKAKYEPQKSVITPEQQKTLDTLLESYKNCYSKISDFSIQNDIVEAILYYKVLTTALGNQEFDSRISAISLELQKIGYSDVTDIINEQYKLQDLSFKNLNQLSSVQIKKAV